MFKEILVSKDLTDYFRLKILVCVIYRTLSDQHLAWVLRLKYGDNSQDMTIGWHMSHWLHRSRRYQRLVLTVANDGDLTRPIDIIKACSILVYGLMNRKINTELQAFYVSLGFPLFKTFYWEKVSTAKWGVIKAQRITLLFLY